MYAPYLDLTMPPPIFRINHAKIKKIVKRGNFYRLLLGGDHDIPLLGERVYWFDPLKFSPDICEEFMRLKSGDYVKLKFYTAVVNKYTHCYIIDFRKVDS